MSGKSSASLSPAISKAQRLLESFAKSLIVKLPTRTSGQVIRRFGARQTTLIADGNTQLVSSVVYTVANEFGVQADILLEARWHPPWMKQSILASGDAWREIDGELLQLTKLVHRRSEDGVMRSCHFKDWTELVQSMEESL